MVANEETFNEKNGSSEADYKEQYKELKRKLRLLIYENEIFQQTLKNSQRKLLRTSRDKSVLLDKLVQYERVELSSSDDELTESSDDGDCVKPEPKKRKETNANNSSTATNKHSISPQASGSNPAKKRKPSTPKSTKTATVSAQPKESLSDNVLSTPESSKTLVDTKSSNNFSQHSLSKDIFNDNFSVKSESNSMYDMDTSPSNVAEDMINADNLGK